VERTLWKATTFYMKNEHYTHDQYTPERETLKMIRMTFIYPTLKKNPGREHERNRNERDTSALIDGE